MISICALILTGCSRPNQNENDELSNYSHSNLVEQASQGIEFFQGSFADALTQAEKDGKDVFVYHYSKLGASSVVMQEAVFPLPEIGAYFNERFISYQIDLGERVHPRGPLVIHYDFHLIVDPVYLILDSDGYGIGHAHGRATPKQLISIINRVIGESESTFDTWQEQYDSGERSTEFIQQYLMNAIEDLAFVKRSGETRPDPSTHLVYVTIHKEIADAYFASKSYKDLINETDAYLIMYFNEHAARGEELVEFVLQHYDEFLAVSSEAAMAQFALNATTNALIGAASNGDEEFIEYLEALETYPMKRALEHERARVSESHHFPESIMATWGLDYHQAIGDWERVYEILLTRLEAKGDTVKESDYVLTAIVLMESNNPAHHKKAVEYGKKVHESNLQAPSYAAVYVAALMVAGNQYTADQVSEEYRKRMVPLFNGSVKLKSYEDELSSLLDRIFENKMSDD